MEQEDATDDSFMAKADRSGSAESNDMVEQTNGREASKSVNGDVEDSEKTKVKKNMKGWAWVEDAAASSETASDVGHANGRQGRPGDAVSLGGVDSAGIPQNGSGADVGGVNDIAD